MKLTPKIEKAIIKAAVLHRGQSRKGEVVYPYITHLYSVAIILSNYTDDEDVIVAGLLHDAIEDTKYTPDKLENDFGKKVREIVLGVTENYSNENKKNSWKERKEKYAANLHGASDESVLVSAADKIHNLNTTIADYKKHGPVIWGNFNAPIEEQMQFYSNILKICHERLKSNIVSEFETVYNEASELFIEK
ncbi:bifunctional (p)ppGpp synthetase/guanosine-3',5'-bis(diphosphate) 3'-pyrophosphohydrolase [Patescibacteria group bacterium]|nr:bifunctional (p)ppGpp synthetase/guanosine-3',5'-bis(diphosphate) 3'-pyrophosphohydrolase [Patescibacteria group bacterium]